MIKFLYLFILTTTLCSASTYEQYFKDTYQCLEKMRDPETGLLRDSVSADLKTIHDPTSPTNIALDLLIQLEAGTPAASKTVGKILKTLNRLPYHIGSGLFYNRYSTDGKRVTEAYLSAVDNIHLAYALWVVNQVRPNEVAANLLKRFEFSYLYDSRTGLYHGGAFFKNGAWKLEDWKYDYFGSEGRSLYSLSYALGLNNDPRIIDKIKRSMTVEIKNEDLRVWDGGAFQLLLPSLLVNETSLKNFFVKYATDAIKNGEKKNYAVPANFSASQVSLTEYNGKAGTIKLVSSTNADLLNLALYKNWESVFTPHAAFLAATVMPEAYEPLLLKAQSLGLYKKGLGWFDGYHVKGDRKGEIVPVYLALDQAMIALSAAKIISRDGMLTGARLIRSQAIKDSKIKYFYTQLIK
jgi:hypothetical protein